MYYNVILIRRYVASVVGRGSDNSIISMVVVSLRIYRLIDCTIVVRIKRLISEWMFRVKLGLRRMGRLGPDVRGETRRRLQRAW
jgi:hypothetical protein